MSARAKQEAENFLPWSLLASLIEPGMSGNDLALRLRDRLGLKDRRYYLRFAVPKATLTESLQGGGYIEQYADDEEPDFSAHGHVISAPRGPFASGRGPKSGPEVRADESR